jgi:hypothetical protein
MSTSFEAHRRIALDPQRPLDHRMSHARSCALVVGRRRGEARSVILARVRDTCGVDLLVPATDEQLIDALGVLEALSMETVRPAG